MKVHNDLNKLPAFHNAVITIGSFDGVHEGHQMIIRRMHDLAQDMQGESVLITFHPHPRLVLEQEPHDLKLITTIEEKINLLQNYGLDHVVIVPFTKAFSQLTATQYISDFLVSRFNPHTIVIGYDHQFGAGRKGNTKLLRRHGARKNFQVIEIPKQEIETIAISSTKIRKALTEGAVEQAARLLGHAFTLTGTVVHGQQIGNQIGFPTANLEIKSPHKLIPSTGIYAVRVRHQEQWFGGMLYIGDRPTLKEHHNRTIEVNIFDFDKEIYGDKLELQFIQFIRADQAFSGLDALRDQLALDRKSSLSVLASIEQQIQTDTRIKPSVSVVILNYNGKQWLEKFLPIVQETDYPELSIVVADNGSTDDSLHFLHTHFPSIETITLEKNYGFADGYNHALTQVESEYYVLLNSDVSVTPNWLDPLIELMERDQSIAACQPKIKSFNETEYFEYAGASGGWLDILGYPFCRGRIFSITEKDNGQYDNTQEIFWASGAALVIRGRLFHSIGGFDPAFFAHAEEIDLCWRLKRAGYKIMVRPRSIVYHVGGGTLNYNTPQKTYLNFRNTLYTILKNESISKLLWLIPLRLSMDFLAGLLFLTQGKWLHVRAIVKAHWSFFPNIRHTLRKRQQYMECIEQCSISDQPNMTAQYQKSIVWQYYVRRKKYFNQL